VNVRAASNGNPTRVDFQLTYCRRELLLQWGGLYHGQTNWVLPSDRRPYGTRTWKDHALQTPFAKHGETWLLTIEMRDTRIHAIEFVLKDEIQDKWLKNNQGNFRIQIPRCDPYASLSSIPHELVQLKAYLSWERKGKPRNSPQQEKQDYEAALKDLQAQLSMGLSLADIRSSLQASNTDRNAENKGNTNTDRNAENKGNRTLASNITPSPDYQKTYTTTPVSHKRWNVDQWINKCIDANAQTKGTCLPASSLLALVEKLVPDSDQGNVVRRHIFKVGSHEVVALLMTLRDDKHLLLGVDMEDYAVLHWGVSKQSSGEWLAPPLEIVPQRSKMLDGACQSYFDKKSTSGISFQQCLDINLRQTEFIGLHFILWSGGTWIKNEGSNFYINLKLSVGDGKGVVKQLLDEISEREKDAERSLMHRFSIATDLIERAKNEGELGLVGMLVWLRFMACRQLTWNKNYNVKPREISAAQHKLTDSLQRIYMDEPNYREIVRLIMSSIGRGGEGDVGQRIRDEILVLQRNNDCKGGMMEEWHQKLHNNTSPDDVIICQALLDYAKSDFNIAVYWKTLNSNGITKERLACYDRPIVSEPQIKRNVKDGFIRDLTSYLRTLKAVHSGADLDSAIATCLGYSSKGHDFMGGVAIRPVGGLSAKLTECLKFVQAHVEDYHTGPLLEKLLESRCELRPLLLKPHERLKDLIFLDIALDSTIRTSKESGHERLRNAQPKDVMYFITLMLENLCLSSVNNEELVFCIKDWYRVTDLHESNDELWALQAKAVLDRIRLILADRAECYHNIYQPSAEYLGVLLRVERWAISIFTEELIRSGSAACLSLLLNRLDPILRSVTNLGSWQIISPVEVRGIVTVVEDIAKIQENVYRQPTVMIANKVKGDEEIPDGVVAVLTPDMPDVLSHIAVRARNSKVCFATCFDKDILGDLKSKKGRAILVQPSTTSLVYSELRSSDLSNESLSSFIPAIALKKKTFSGKYAISFEEFTSELVGAKSVNIQYLGRKLPSWVKVPISVALPYGVFEAVLREVVNKDVANQVVSLSRIVAAGNLSKLHDIRQTILQLKAPSQLINELSSKMKTKRMPWPGDEGEGRWNQAWLAIKKVWASKWNERAYISIQKAKMDHNSLCMAVLVQEIICADYAFVIHTKNPLSGNPTEIYAEIVKGLGETLVSAYPGRAMSFVTKKSDLNSPKVLGYPSKQIGLFIKRSIIFRSDSNGEDLKGYSGAGLYDSVPMDKEDKVVVDYSSDRLIVDRAYQKYIFSKIALVGKVIEDLYGSAQDIEGVVKDGEIYVVQTRPQM
ncbi:hypothetical protein AMTR_s00033p00208970, partial [Amborella trichopoda]